MLAWCRQIETVRCSIEELDLDERFDVVLLASHLVNAPEPQRTRFLTAARRHLSPGGLVVAQRHRPGWIRAATDSEHDDGTTQTTLTVLDRPAPDLLHARIRYATAAAAWQHEFTTCELDDAALPGALAAAGLRFDRMLTDSGDWFTAVKS
jgi:SAM-dependent methyltransferase